MTTILYKKGMVLAIIVLFIGAGIVPSISGNISDNKYSETIEMISLNDPPGEEWNKTYGESLEDVGNCVQQTTDGGFIIAGKQQFEYAADAWLIKTDADGNKLWDEIFWDEQSYFHDVQLTSDGGYILTGFSWDIQRRGGIWLLKINRDGNVEWSKGYGGDDGEQGFSVQQTTDGGYIVVGETSSFGQEDPSIWLVKVDSNGNHEWDKIFGGDGFNFGNSVKQTTDFGYIITGSTYSNSKGEDDVRLIKTDPVGNVEWDKTFGGENRDYGLMVLQTTDGYVVIGSTESFGPKWYSAVWLIKTDADGNELWNKTFGGINDYDQSRAIQLTSDGGYIITGFVYPTKGDDCSDIWLIKTDADGNELWNMTLGGTSWDYGNYVVQTDDGGYAVVGGTKSFGDENGDVWLIKLAAENYPPDRPSTPQGTISGKTGIVYDYTSITIDPDGDKLVYGWDWEGDMIVDEWTDLHDSGEIIEMSHSWDIEGSYEIRVIAKDTYGAESPWSDPLAISMPKNKAINGPFFDFFTDHLEMFPLLRLLLQRLGL